MRVGTARELGLLVRDRRHDLRLSQQALADRAGVSRPWLVAVERGHPRAELGKLLNLLAELGLTFHVTPTSTAHGGTVDLDELLTRHDERSTR